MQKDDVLKKKKEKHTFTESALRLGKTRLSFQERIWQHCVVVFFLKKKALFQPETQAILNHSLLRVTQGILHQAGQE